MISGKQARAISSGLSSIANAPSNPINTLNTSYVSLSSKQFSALSTSHVATISANALSQLQGLNLNTISFGPDTIHHQVKKYEVYEAPEDVLTLSTALQRHNKLCVDPSARIHKLLDSKLFNKIEPEDRNKAQDIRDYYSKKIMMWKLKDIKLTKFREDMNTLIHSDGLMFKEEVLGLAYHLPTFYDFDIEMDNIKSNLTPNQGFDKLDKDMKPRKMNLDVELVPLNRLDRKTKRGLTHQYWFKDTDLDAGCMIALTEKNPLLHIWDHIFSTEKVLKITGNYVRTKLDDFEYFSIRDWNMTQT